MVARTSGGRGRKKNEIVAEEVRTVEVMSADETMVDEAVSWINNKIKNNIHGTYLEIGNYVFTQFFGGEIARVSSFNPHKASSFRKLAERSDIDLMISKSHLQRAVQVAVQEKLLLPTVPALGQLSFSHKALLLPLKNDAKKEKLVIKAAEEHLSYRKLRELVKTAKEKQPRSPAGRPELPGFLKSVSKIFYLTTRADSLGGLDQETLADMKDAELSQLHNRIAHIRSTIDQVNEALERLALSKKNETSADPENVEAETT